MQWTILCFHSDVAATIFCSDVQPPVVYAQRTSASFPPNRLSCRSYFLAGMQVFACRSVFHLFFFFRFFSKCLLLKTKLTLHCLCISGLPLPAEPADVTKRKVDKSARTLSSSGQNGSSLFVSAAGMRTNCWGQTTMWCHAVGGRRCVLWSVFSR